MNFVRSLAQDDWFYNALNIYYSKINIIIHIKYIN